MSWVDWAIGGILAICAFQGFTSGFTRQITSLAGLLVGLLLAIFFTSQLASGLFWCIGPNIPAEAIAFTLIFLGTYIGVNLLSLAIWQHDRVEGAGQADKVAGALVGFVLGILILEILAIGSVRLGLPQAQDIEASEAGGWLLMLGERVGSFLP